jgi:non-ribosomal peptide synthetase-like protein
MPPIDPAAAARTDASWLGSPSFELPHRQESTEFDVHSTFEPTRTMWLQRGFIEFWRVILPSTCFLSLTSVLLSAVLLLQDHLYFWELLLIFPFLYATAGVTAVLMVVAFKWLLMGRYRPAEYPLWSTFVWKTELVTSLHENLAKQFLVRALSGTPMMAWYLRLMGAKVGRRVYLETTEFTEFDLVSLGDDVALNDDATIQTHLFEDRVMKMSHVRIGDRCTVGSQALVLYDTQMEAGAELNDLSLLMKGETLPAGTRWEGIPARRPTS